MRAIRQSEKELARILEPSLGDDEETEEGKDEDSVAAEAAEERSFNKLILELQKDKKRWSPNQKSRQNFKSMGLGICCLQMAGLLEHQEPTFGCASDPQHEKFRGLLKEDALADPTKASEYKTAERELMADTSARSGAVFSTLSHCADKSLIKH